MNKIMSQIRLGTASEDLLKKMGAFTLYSNMAEFLIIQGVRLCEKISVESIRAWGLEMIDPRSEIELFEVKKTRKLLETTELLLTTDAPEDLKKIIKDFISAANIFLNKRNNVTHNICHPKNYEIEPLIQALKDSDKSFQDLATKQRNLVERVLGSKTEIIN